MFNAMTKAANHYYDTEVSYDDIKNIPLQSRYKINTYIVERAHPVYEAIVDMKLITRHLTIVDDKYIVVDEVWSEK